ncbi:hypothetical protein UCDDA912_g02980 [Diaporthe ampelina]|uniref:DUF7704 domain-containing protein n=1 Tax=Diaporthe ampelina TaxID=1214573 RepID=A0A0G2IBD8_9PEZI|nr:hypothetical protein UCDDA912_g02980 [Diaporthe ampelina]
MAQPKIAAAHRILFLYAEPFAALYGALLVARAPLKYLYLVHPAAPAHYHPSLQVVLDQLAATYFLFAFNQAVVLRVAGDGPGGLRVWTAMICGMLLCDLLHINAAGNALGWGFLLHPAGWRFEEWMVMVPTYGFAAARVAFLLGFGVATEEARPKIKTG